MLTRRELLQGGGVCLATLGFSRSAAVAEEVHTLAGTQPLTWEGSFPDLIMDGAHRYVEQKIAESIETRQKYWHRDFSSRDAYEKSVAPNRGRFVKQIGAVDARPSSVIMERFGDDENPSLVAETEAYSVHQVRWPVPTHITGSRM